MGDIPEDEEYQIQTQVERIRQILRDAFPDAYCQPLEDRSFTHDEFIEMRTDLQLFMPEDLPLFLPLILEELMDTHSNDDVVTENAEFVLMNLNVDAYVSEETYAFRRELCGDALVERERSENEFRRNFGRESYARITPDQAKAIYQWLLLARDWRDYSSSCCSDDLKGALEYWENRANAV